MKQRVFPPFWVQVCPILSRKAGSFTPGPQKELESAEPLKACRQCDFEVASWVAVLRPPLLRNVRFVLCSTLSADSGSLECGGPDQECVLTGSDQRPGRQEPENGENGEVKPRVVFVLGGPGRTPHCLRISCAMSGADIGDATTRIRERNALWKNVRRI
eukprot:2188476-Rhodomonas_salina.1